jgi:hypothetical protein
MAIEGECFCGAMTYAFDGPIEPATRCHCSRCRKAFGGVGSAMTRVGPDFRWTAGDDLLTSYVGKHGYGIGFCKICGSTLVGLKDGAVMGITLGSLCEDPSVQVGQHIFVDSKACWDVIPDDAAHHAEWPVNGPANEFTD